MSGQESTGLVEIVAGLVASTSVIFNAWFWYDKKRGDKRLDKHGERIDKLETKQAVHESRFVDDQGARVIVRDETASLKEQHAELKGMVTQLGDGVSAIASSQQVQTEILKNLERRLDELREDYKK